MSVEELKKMEESLESLGITKVEKSSEGYVDFKVKKCPLDVFEDFRQFCKNETDGSWDFGLKLLLDRSKMLMYLLSNNNKEEAYETAPNGEDSSKFKSMRGDD